MTEIQSSLCHEQISREAPQLVSVLKAMKEGLDCVTNKLQSLTAEVKADKFPTSEGMSYLEAKHLLLLNYCQSLVYYLLSKAKGLSIQGHPVVRSLVEIRLFLEKLRPIDKKLQYQIQKLTSTTTTKTNESALISEEADESKRTQNPDLLKLRPNPDFVDIKDQAFSEQGSGKYIPPRIVPTSMEDGKMSKQEKNALRKEKLDFRHAKNSLLMRELINEREGRPEELKENEGIAESKELTKFVEKMEMRDRAEENLYTRSNLSKHDKKKMKHLQKSRNGLKGLTESFLDDISILPLGDAMEEQPSSFNAGGRSGNKKFNNKRKRKY